MKSLTQGGQSNLQDRVIQSGLDAITGVDAPRIISLFKALAIYAEGECSVSYLISRCIASLCCARRDSSGCDSQCSVGVNRFEKTQAIVRDTDSPVDVTIAVAKHRAWFFVKRNLYGK